MLRSIINGKENKKGRKDTEDTEGQEAKMGGNVSLDAISEVSFGSGMDKTKEDRRKLSKEKENRKSSSEGSFGSSVDKVEEDRSKRSKEKENMKQIMARKPRPLNDQDLIEEKGRRERRRNNVSIYFPETKENSKDRIMDVIAKKCGLDVRRKTLMKYKRDGLMIVSCKDWNDKRELMNRSSDLKGTDIWMRNDWTKREKEVQKWLWEVAANEKRLGRQAVVSYMRINFGDGWWRWNDRTGNIELQEYEQGKELLFRDEQQSFRGGRWQ